MTDADLITLAANGSNEHFEILWLRHRPFLWNCLIRILRHWHATEDALQETAIQVHRKLKTFEGRSDGSVKGWLYKVALNCARRSFRAVKTRKLHYSEDLPPGILEELQPRTPEVHNGYHAAYNRELINIIRKTADKVPEDYRGIYKAKYFNELSHPEVSAIFNLSIPATKSRLHRGCLIARQKIKIAMRDCEL